MDDVTVSDDLASDDGGLPFLKERRRKDAEEVASGLRSAQSLLAVKQNDLVGFVFTFNPDSEFDRPGVGW